MGPSLPQMGIEYIVKDRNALRQLNRIRGSLLRTEQLQKRIATATERSARRQSQAVARSSRMQVNSLRQLRRVMITYLFFTRIFTQAIGAAWNAMAEAAEAATQRAGARVLGRAQGVDVGPIAAELRAISEGTLSVRKSIAAVQQAMLQDQGQFVNQYANLWQAARVAAVTAGGEATDHFETFLEALSGADAGIIDSASSLYNAEVATLKYALSVGKTVDQLDPLVKTQILLNTIRERTLELMEAGAQAALDETKDLDTMTAAWDDFKTVMGTVIEQSLESTGTFEGMTGAINLLTEGVIQAVAALAGLQAGLNIPKGPIEAGLILSQQILGTGGFFDPSESERVRQEVIAKAREAQGGFSDTVGDMERTYDRVIKTPSINIDPIIDHMLKRQTIIDDHNQAVERIRLQHQNRLEDIQVRYHRTVHRVELRAQRSREKSWRSYYRRVQRETEDHLLAIAQATDKYYQTRRHKQEEFLIRSIQSERLYRYERSLLVAEGDVLAIEDLDARNALETQSKDENFTQELREDEQNFSLKLQQRREQFELELMQIRRALDDQLLEVSIKLRDQLDEAAWARQEDIRQAQRDWQQRLDQELLNYQQELDQWKRHWAKISEQTKVGAAQITSIIQEYFGPGGIADNITEQFLQRFQQRTDIRNLVSRITGYSNVSGSSTRQLYSSGRWPNPEGGWFRGPGFQFGGETIVSRPTLIAAGEGYSPEIVSVQPVANRHSGSISLSWAGNPISIQGQSGLAGADLSGIGNAISQGLVVQMTNELNNRRG